MKNVNLQLIESKLEHVAEYVKRLDIVLKYSDEEIRSDFLKLHALERLVQLTVDEMVDMNTHIIRYSDVKTPDDFQSGFRILAEMSILPTDFAERIAPTVGLRNRLMHRYEEIRPELLISVVRSEKDDFRKYVGYIRAKYPHP